MAAPKEARVPDIGGYDDVPVIEVLVKAGDAVAKDQGLVTLESDKATMEVPAPFAGTVREVKVKLGDTLSEGSLVARPLLDPELEHSSVSLIHRLGRQLDGAPARLLSQLENSLKNWAPSQATTPHVEDELVPAA